METGTVSFPSLTKAAGFAADYLNAKGGVHGHPLKIVSCDMTNDEQNAAACGQQFANNSSIDAVAMSMAVDAGPFYTALAAANKPVLGGFAITPADYSPPGAYFIYPGPTYYYGLARWIKAQGDIHSITYFLNPSVTLESGEAILASQLPGVKITQVHIPENAGNMTPYVASSNAGSTDLTIVFSDASPLCGPLAQAMQSLGVKPKSLVFNPVCAPMTSIQQDPSLYSGWYLANITKEPVAGTDDADTNEMLQAFKTYGGGAQPQSFDPVGWGTVLTLGNILNSIAGTLDSASIAKAIETYSGAVPMGGRSISCPGPKPFTATCADNVILYQVGANGGLTLKLT